MKENNDIFLAGGDALLYLDEPMQKKRKSAKLFWGNPFSTYVSHDSTPLLYASVHIFDDLPSIPLVTYVLNWWRISQPKNKQQHSNIILTEM